MINLFKKEIVFEGQKCFVYKQDKDSISFNKDKRHHTKNIKITFKKGIVKAVDNNLQKEILYELDHNPEYPTEVLIDIATDFVVNKRNYFFVYQNDSFKYECHGGYLWAPIDDIPDHLRLKDLKPGDIVLHSVNRKIVALGVVKGTIEECDFPDYDRFYEDITQKPQSFVFYNFCYCHNKCYCENYDNCLTKQYRINHFCKKGRKIKVKYFKLKTPIESKRIENEIRKYGQGYGQPFGTPDPNEHIKQRYNQGDDSWGKFGYLFNLRPELFWAYRKVSSYHNDDIFDDVYYYADMFKDNGNHIIFSPSLENKEVVTLSSIVSIVYPDNREKELDVYDITGDKSIARKNKIHFASSNTQLMKNLLGKEIGDVFYSPLKNGGKRKIKIVDIKN